MGVLSFFQSPKTNVGASLLAIAVCHSTLMSTDRAPSRAGSLPQGIYVFLQAGGISSDADMN